MLQVNRRTESVKCTIDELEGCVPMEVWEAVVQNPYKSVMISLLRLDPNMSNPLANWDARRIARNKKSSVWWSIAPSLRHHWPELEQADTDFWFLSEVRCTLAAQ